MRSRRVIVTSRWRHTRLLCGLRPDGRVAPRRRETTDALRPAGAIDRDARPMRNVRCGGDSRHEVQRCAYTQVVMGQRQGRLRPSAGTRHVVTIALAPAGVRAKARRRKLVLFGRGFRKMALFMRVSRERRSRLDESHCPVPTAIDRDATGAPAEAVAALGRCRGRTSPRRGASHRQPDARGHRPTRDAIGGAGRSHRVVREMSRPA